MSKDSKPSDRVLVEQEYVPRLPIWYMLLPGQLLRRASRLIERLASRLGRFDRWAIHVIRRPRLNDCSCPVRLYLGSGYKRIEGFISVDLFPSRGTDLVMNVLDLTLDSGSVDEIYSSHMIEHLTKEEFDQALSEWFRVLKPGGRITLRCPNLLWQLERFLSAGYNEKWGHYITTIFGITERGPGHQHKNGFSPRRLDELLSNKGFQVEECRAATTRGNQNPDADIFCVAYKPKAS